MMWEEANGPIPPKHEIDHIDQDSDNNTLENFQCIPAKQHARKSKAHQEALKREREERQAQKEAAPQPIAPEPWDIDPITPGGSDKIE